MRNNNHQGNNGSIGKNGAKKETNKEAHGGLKTMHGDIKIAQQQHGTKGATKIKVEVARKQVDTMSTFH